MGRNKYGYPTPDPTRFARSGKKRGFAEGGSVADDDRSLWGKLTGAETRAERVSRWNREADESLARSTASKEAPPVVIAPPPDTSTVGRIKQHKRDLDAVITTEGAAQAKKRGGIVKARGCGCATKGHTKGKLR